MGSIKPDVAAPELQAGERVRGQHAHHRRTDHNRDGDDNAVDELHHERNEAEELPVAGKCQVGGEPYRREGELQARRLERVH
jgi:hypothetical protein